MMILYGLQNKPIPFLIRFELTPLIHDALMDYCPPVVDSIPPLWARPVKENTQNHHTKKQYKSETPLNKSPSLEKEIFNRNQTHRLQ